MTSLENPAPEDSQAMEGAADDAIIGRAFKGSLWVLGAVVITAAIVLVAIFVFRLWEADSPLPPAPSIPAQRQDLSTPVPVMRFTDVTREAGVRFHHENGARGGKLLPETMGSGCAFFDVENDGDPDLFLINAMPWPQDPRSQEMPTSALYRNNGSGRFEDVTKAAGLAVTLYGVGVATGDFDNDGYVDVFITAVGENRLFRNLEGTFQDVTAAAGVAGAADAWSTSAAFFDADLDGDLDLFVCNYVGWSKELDEQLDFRLTGIGRAYGPPNDFPGTQPYFYRNQGNGKFRDATKEAGFLVHGTSGEPIAKALAVLPIDADRDGHTDLFVANDTVRNFFYRSRGDGTFEEHGSEFGVAYDRNGSATGAMGVDAAYYRGDSTLGIGVGNFSGEMSSLYASTDDSLLFTDETINEGIGPVSRKLLSFGLFFFDADLDGRPDILQTNGHLEEEIHQVQPSQNYRQPSQLFWNRGPEALGAFVPVPGEKTGDLAKPVVGRGAAYADIDLDGDLDVVITQVADRPLLLRNEQGLGHHWLRLKLVGTRANRDAIGAWVEVEVGGTVQRQQVQPTRSYLSQVELELTFGLGTSPKADVVRVGWPGEDEPRTLGSLAGDQRHVLRQ